MIKPIATLFLTAVVFSSAWSEDASPFNFISSGNWGSYSLGQDGSRAVTNTSLDGILMSIDFNPSNCASPYLMIHVGGAQVSDIGKYNVLHRNVKLRVDRIDMWNIDDVVTSIQESADGESAVSVLTIPVNDEFLNEMRSGNTLRIKVEAVPAFHASLRGSRSAINRASALCRKIAESTRDDDRYFEDERYF